jgi:hypothetical protein
MSSLSTQRCFNHGFREAVARCPSCGRFFCRECVTEHEGRVLCAACLSEDVSGPAPRTRTFAALRSLAALMLGILILWLMFHSAGRLLLLLPTAFHEGTIFKDLW